MSITQKKRAKIIADAYKNWGAEGKKALDVGCGNGVVSDVLVADLELNLCGTDIIDYRTTNIPFKQMENPGELPFDDLSFDFVMFNDVLHHSEHIESLILEGKRVGHSLLIFEDKQSFLLTIVDVVLNHIYSSRMPVPLNFKTKEEWCLLFDKLGLEWEAGEVSYPFWYPFQHFAFRLVKRT